jgi:hypothetical protein
MTVRGKDAALPYFLLVDDEFHRLHVQLRNASQKNDQSKWHQIAEKFAQNIKKTLPISVLGSDLVEMAAKHLPEGKIDLGSASVLLDVYRRREKKGWRNFTSQRELQKRLVCRKCVQGWLNNYTNNRIVWDKRKQEHGNTYIIGNTGITNSCNIEFNNQGYAKHPNKDKSVQIDPGYRCKGTEKTPLYPLKGISLNVMNEKYSWSKRLFIKTHPVERDYPQVQEKMVSFENYSSSDKTSHVNRMAGFIALNALSEYGVRDLRKDAQFSYFEYQNTEVVILEGISIKRGPSSASVQYLLYPSGSTIKSSFEDLNKQQPLGIFLFVKQRHLFQPHELRDKLEIFDAVPLKVSEGLSQHLNWKPTEGQLYRLRESFYQNNEGEQSGNLNQSKIDFNRLKAKSPLLSKIREKHPLLQLPILQTSLKYILAFKHSDSYVNPIGNEQLISAKSGDRILVRATGFKLRDTKLTLEIFPEDFGSAALAERQEVNLNNGFASFIVPSAKRSKTYRINLSARDNMIPEPLVFTLKVSGSNNPNPPTDVHLDTRYETNKNILLAYNIRKLKEKLEIDEGMATQLLRQGRYMELVKLEISKNSEEMFTVPTSRIQQRYIGLDFISFGSSGGELELGQRLRSSGLYFPVPPEMDNGDESRYMSTNKWDAFKDHIVRLDSNYHLLLTASPLDLWGISLDDDALKQKGLIVTNHGTFIKGKIPSELSDVEIVERPKFLDLYAKTPGQHFDILNKIIDTIPREKRKSYKNHLNQNFVVTHEFQPTGNKWRVWGNNAIPPRASWYPVSKLNLSEMGITKTPLKAEHHDKNTVFFDVVFIERESGDERQILVRRHHENGEVDYLSIARFIKQNADYWAQNQLEWVSDIERNDIQELEHLFLWIGGKFKGQDLKRAYDWNFLQIETLRAFTAISNQAVDDNVLKWVCPVPLYKYLDGVRGDLMQGLLQDPVMRHNAALKQAVENAVRRWTWTQKSGEN